MATSLSAWLLLSGFCYSCMPEWATLVNIFITSFTKKQSVMDTYMWIPCVNSGFHIVFSSHTSIDVFTPLFFSHSQIYFAPTCGSRFFFLFKRDISLADKWKPSCDLKHTCFVASLWRIQTAKNTACVTEMKHSCVLVTVCTLKIGIKSLVVFLISLFNANAFCML